MLTAEYDYATDIAVQREEAAKEAWQKAEKATWQKAEKAVKEAWQKSSLQNALQNARNLKSLGVPLEIISQGVGLSVEEIENL